MKFFFLPICMALPFLLSAQESYYGALDTITIHGFSLVSGNRNDSCQTQDVQPGQPIKYYSDCKEISKSQYDIYSEEYRQIKDCTPCVVKRLNYQDSLLSYSTQYTDCRVGNYIEYYSSGKPKTMGHYKVNETGKWNRIYPRGYCSVKNGFWSHFDSLGTLLYTETYNEDTLIGKIDTVFYPEFLNLLTYNANSILGVKLPWDNNITIEAVKAIHLSINNFVNNIKNENFPAAPGPFNVPFVLKEIVDFVIIGYMVSEDNPDIYEIGFHPANFKGSAGRITVSINIKTSKALKVYMKADA
jgi:hypothetical protein